MSIYRAIIARGPCGHITAWAAAEDMAGHLIDTSELRRKWEDRGDKVEEILDDNSKRLKMCPPSCQAVRLGM